MQHFTGKICEWKTERYTIIENACFILPFASVALCKMSFYNEGHNLFLRLYANIKNMCKMFELNV